jgi:hypothetical protein
MSTKMKIEYNGHDQVEEHTHLPVQALCDIPVMDLPSTWTLRLAF